jgi:phenylpyruvate tautomerase PptA (4-oxalocrotonate tautomerase family)
MPDVLVEVKGSWLADRKIQFAEAIHAALVETLKTPEDDKALRVIEHAPDNFTIPRAAGHTYTRIEIVMFAGRSRETKRALYKTIVAHLAPFGVPGADIKIVLIEVPAENVGFRGGKAACDIDIGYEVQV